jgi:hypothetical protein
MINPLGYYRTSFKMVECLKHDITITLQKNIIDTSNKVVLR